MKKLFFVLSVIACMFMSPQDCNAQFWGKTRKTPCNFSCDKDNYGATGIATGLPEDLSLLLQKANESVEGLITQRMSKHVKKVAQQITETISTSGGKQQNLAHNTSLLEAEILELLASVDADCTEISDPDNKTGRIYVFVGYKIPKKTIEEAIDRGLNELTNGEAKEIRNRAKEIKEEFAKSLREDVDKENNGEDE